jgi:hypothetical protein
VYRLSLWATFVGGERVIREIQLMFASGEVQVLSLVTVFCDMPFTAYIHSPLILSKVSPLSLSRLFSSQYRSYKFHRFTCAGACVSG